jgi:hypothetical protein
MEPAKRQRLEAAGWSVGDTSDFLGLSSEEAAFVEMKLARGQAPKAATREPTAHSASPCQAN